MYSSSSMISLTFFFTSGSDITTYVHGSVWAPLGPVPAKSIVVTVPGNGNPLLSKIYNSYLYFMTFWRYLFKISATDRSFWPRIFSVMFIKKLDVDLTRTYYFFFNNLCKNITLVVCTLALCSRCLGHNLEASVCSHSTSDRLWHSISTGWLKRWVLIDPCITFILWGMISSNRSWWLPMISLPDRYSKSSYHTLFIEHDLSSWYIMNKMFNNQTADKRVRLSNRDMKNDKEF